MIVTLDELSNWIRVSILMKMPLESIILAAEELVEGILRFPLNEFEGNVPEAVKHAVFFTVSKFYEDRNELDTAEINSILRALLFSYRKAEW